MRNVLFAVLLLFCAGALHAQEPEAGPEKEPAAAAVEVAPAPAAETPERVSDMQPRGVTAAEIASVRLAAPAPADATAAQLGAPRNFWWIVAAIVVAGIILAVIL